MHRFNLYTQNLIQRAIDVEQLKSHGKFGAANQSNAFQRNVISSKDCEQKDQSYVNVDIIFNVKRKIKKWMRIWINHSDSSHPHWILLASFENELREKKFSLKGIYDSYIWLDIFFWCIKYDIKKILMEKKKTNLTANCLQLNLIISESSKRKNGDGWKRRRIHGW